ncbi:MULTISPECIES: glycogen synthase [Pontibacillus]|uniref:Glycogen synthase n=1 Tax=Pontibacillus chungwhensis TaxID=265426 RepID=A0ABY8UYQ0_9BACI|nr:MULTISPECIES: glycogen/starch synthase [Pontibacillus]MCD5325487.1 glycogen/starch synthase [Pontibacillus sp. HN14]WIF98599.1 glycogen/starch synthase [Pontibacillus chungwhensis]
MNVLHIASECMPFCKTNEVADLLGSLPKALQEKGVEVSVILPLYKAIPSHFRTVMDTRATCRVRLGWREKGFHLKEAVFDGIRYYFVEQEEYFGEEEIYGDPQSFHEAERFAFFSQAVLEVLPELKHKPDLLHCHDWRTGFIPYLLSEAYSHDPYYDSLKTVFTIHQMNEQGVYPSGTFHDLMGCEEARCEFYGGVNVTKGALVYSDHLTTLSETFASEIGDPYFGCGLDGVIREQQAKLTGIQIGMDGSVYDPYTDPSLVCHPPLKEWKSVNKRVLQEQLHLPVREVPVFLLDTPLVGDKGMDLIVHVFDEMMEEDVQVLVIGKGDPIFEEKLKAFEETYRGKMFVHLGSDEELLRQMYAASDISLLPSKYEPGTSKTLMAFRYEVVPLVRETGGLRDTVVSFNEFTGEGTGFSFTCYNAHDMLHTFRRALHFYDDPLLWWRITQNIKACDCGWHQPSAAYVNLYQKLLLYTDQEVRL